MKKSTNPIAEANNVPITSGAQLPLWFAEDSTALEFQPLAEDIASDVLVVGGGISGLTTAYCLAKEGRNVTLVEDGIIGSGETGRTTAHITHALDDRYFEIEKTFDRETAHLAAQSHTAAIEWIATTVQRHGISCHFRRVDGYLFLDPTDSEESLTKEYEATKRAGLDTKLLERIPFQSGGDGPCICFPNQAQFHSILYLKGLAKAFIEAGGKIYTHTRAENITKQGATANGFTIKAKHIVVATNTPINNFATMHTKQWPYRSYVIGSKIPKGQLPFALWWDTGNMKSIWIAKPYHYVRLEEFDASSDILIVGGEDHRTGQADEENINEEQRYGRLEAWARRHFPIMGNIDFKWSGQIMEPLDGLAFIGKNPGDENIYIITGDSGNGITHGTLGGLIVTYLIIGRSNPWSKIYDPSRITLKKTVDFLQEAGNMVAQYSDWFTSGDVKSITELGIRQGAILSSGLKKLAVYRDENNLLHTCSAVCPHMGAILQWNANERTFDCPAHGSRFSCEGKLLNGPAGGDLQKVD